MAEHTKATAAAVSSVRVMLSVFSAASRASPDGGHPDNPSANPPYVDITMLSFRQAARFRADKREVNG